MGFQKCKRLLALLLCAVVVSLCLPSNVIYAKGLLNPVQGAAQSQGAGKGALSTATLKRVAQSYQVPEEFLAEIEGKKSVSISDFKKYADTYSLPAQYVQRFITDSFVFKSGSRLQYYPVDTKLAKNDYNWNNLVYGASGEIKYQSGGRSKALKGIDVSEFQGNIDWNRVKADGVSFAFIRVGYRGYSSGKIVLDNYFEQNMRNAAAAGVKVGVYFYSQAVNAQEAVEEANFVLSHIKGYQVDYPVVFDIEAAGYASARTNGLTKQTATQLTKAFCDTVKAAGYHPMIYTNSNWFVTKLDMHQLTGYDKWLAQYYLVPFFPYEFKIWQYTGKGRVDGINGNVDMNLGFSDFNRTGAHLKLGAS